MHGDGRIFRYKNSSRYWIAYYVRGKEIRESAGKTEVEAKRRLKARLKEIAGDRFVGLEAERLTIGELLDSYMLDLQNRRAKSFSTIGCHVKPVRETFGEVRAMDFRSVDAEGYRSNRSSLGYAPQTVDHELGQLRAAFRLARKQERINRVPYIPMYNAKNARKGFLEASQVEAIVGHLPEPLADLTRFAYSSGWRKGEIVSLRWEQVDRSAREVRLFDSKNGRGRVLPLDDALSALLERRWQAREYALSDGTTALSAFVFHRSDGQSVGSFYKVWRRACEQANVPGTLFHDLRRSAVRDLIRAGVPQSVAMAITGHETDSVFRRYDIASEQDKRTALERTRAYREKRAEGNVASFSPRNS
jgi:integrase